MVVRVFAAHAIALPDVEACMATLSESCSARDVGSLVLALKLAPEPDR